MFLKPSDKSLKVFDPATKLHLPMEGKKVAKSSYWMRRIADGDVVEAKEPIKKKVIKKESEKNKESKS